MDPEDSLPHQEWPTRSSDTAAIWQDDYVTLEQEVVYETVPPPPPARNSPDRNNSIGLGLLFGLAVFAAVALGGLAAWWLTRNDENRTAATTTVTTRTATATVTPSAATTVVVPALAGLEERAALAALASAGLSPKVERRTTGPTNGRVFSQHPSGLAKVAPGARVTIILNLSKTTQPLKPAPSPNTSATTHVTKPVAAVTKTTAAPNPTGATSARVSAVPNLSGRNEQEAVQALNAAGLVPSILFVPARDPLGSVMGQAKPAGSRIAAASTVTITISNGPGQNPDETVPDVVGKTLIDALGTVNAQQLRMIYLRKAVPTQDQAGKIVQQTPPPGAHAPRNGQVLVYLGAFPTGE